MASLVSSFLCFLSVLVACIAAKPPCPCVSKSYCRYMTDPPKQEVLGWAVSKSRWTGYMNYNWSKITTVVQFGDEDFSGLMCQAHAKKVRAVLAGFFPVANLTSDFYRNAWIKTMVHKSIVGFADGINIDIEEPIAAGSPEHKLLVTLVNDTRNAFLAVNKHAQVTFDVAWSPDCVDKRCYDAVGLSEVTDFLVVMSYDERGQIFHPEPCVAGANSPYGQTIVGLERYLFLGIPASKLVLGQPWYGYDYNCTVIEPASQTCSIKKVPYEGAPCSDAAGHQKEFKDVMELLKKSSTGRLWDRTARAPYFNYVANAHEVHQVWYDDVESLSVKYDLVQKLGLRGIAIWSPDFLNYGDESVSEPMWTALNVTL